ncbi:MAG: helix-turn-helix domain-containing protein, partial [Gammaproteobacteria bacterium]|nr:helix-turn-helix domain-containing protein [Gammaproteobacteria bacterium]
LKRYPEVADEVMRRMAAMVRGLTERVVELSTLCVRKRARIELLRLAETNAGDDINCGVIRERHDAIAKMVSTTREAVTRDLGEFVKLGVIEKSERNGGPLFVPDLDRLRQISKQ